MNIKELKEAAERATPGPWEATVEDNGDRLSVFSAGEQSVVGGCGCCGSPWTDSKHAQGNARYIALANPSTIISLIERYEQMEEALRNAKGFLGTPISRRRNDGDSFYDETVKSILSALEEPKE